MNRLVIPLDANFEAQTLQNFGDPKQTGSFFGATSAVA